MNLIDFLAYQPFHHEYLDTIMILFDLSEIQTAYNQNLIIIDSIEVKLNIQ